MKKNEQAEDIQRLKAYQELHGVKETSGTPCPLRLVRAHKPGFDCNHHFPPGADHSRLWIKEGRAFSYTFEPYGMSKERMEALNCYCDEHGLDYRLTGRSWWNPGDTLLIEVRRKGAW